MPTFNNILRGGRSVSGNSEAPRSRRGNQTAQVDQYWSGLSPSGGIGVEFLIVGGGGGGAGGYQVGGTIVNSAGAGGGGISITSVPITAVKGTYTITIGANGTGGNQAGSGVTANGTNGGTSSITDPLSAIVVTAGGGNGSLCTNPATAGTGGTGSTSNGTTGTLTADNAWTGGYTTNWSGSSLTFGRGGNTNPVGGGASATANTGDGGVAGAGSNPFSGGAGGTGIGFMRILTENASKVLSTTGSPTTFTSGSFTYYRWTVSGTVTLAS